MGGFLGECLGEAPGAPHPGPTPRLENRPWAGGFERAVWTWRLGTPEARQGPVATRQDAPSARGAPDPTRRPALNQPGGSALREG
jgi:hypothetical protein